MSLLGFLGRRAADAVLPGSGAALGMLQRLRPLIPYALAAAAALIVGFLIWRAPWAEHRQTAKDAARWQAVMERAQQRMAKAERALRDADAAVRAQNSSIKAHADAEHAALANAARLRAQADQRDVGRRATIARLQAAAAKPGTGAPCAAPEELKEAWK